MSLLILRRAFCLSSGCDSSSVLASFVFRGAAPLQALRPSCGSHFLSSCAGLPSSAPAPPARFATGAGAIHIGGGRAPHRSFTNVFSNITNAFTQGFKDKKLDKQRTSLGDYCHPLYVLLAVLSLLRLRSPVFVPCRAALIRAGELTLWQLSYVSSLPTYGMKEHIGMLEQMSEKAGLNNLMTNLVTAVSKEQRAALEEQVRLPQTRATRHSLSRCC